MSVRIGFIGTGGISQSHLTNLLQIPAAEVVALCDLVPAQMESTQMEVNKSPGAAKSGRKLEAARYTDYRAMLRQEKLDAVYICIPPYAHGEMEMDILAAGLPMLIEKPVALELSLAGGILAEIKRRNALVAVGYQLRYGETMQLAKNAMTGKKIGMAVVMRFGRVPPAPWFIYQDKSGGQLIEQATHQVDLLRYLIGEVKTVYAAGATRILPDRYAGLDIFDVNCVTMTFANGVVANLANNLIADLGSPPEATGLHIMCEGLTLTYTGGVRLTTPAGKQELPREANPMLNEDQAFVTAVAEGKPELIVSDYASGVRTLAVTMAADLSARRGQPVDVEDMLRKEAPSALGD